MKFETQKNGLVKLSCYEQWVLLGTLRLALVITYFYTYVCLCICMYICTFTSLVYRSDLADFACHCSPPTHLRLSNHYLIETKIKRHNNMPLFHVP